jgi:hypothetical protein
MMRFLFMTVLLSCCIMLWSASPITINVLSDYLKPMLSNPPAIQYQLVKEDTLYKLIYPISPAGYHLQIAENSTYSLMNKSGKVYWTKQTSKSLHMADKQFMNVTAADDIYQINKYGTIVMKDSTEKRFMIIDKTGKHYYLPLNTGDMESHGFIGDKYWFFTENGDNPNSSDPDGPYYTMQYFKTHCGYLLINEQGKIHVSVELQNKGEMYAALSPDGNTIIVDWDRSSDDSTVIEFNLLAVSGKVIRVFNATDINVNTSAYSEAGDLIVMNFGTSYWLIDPNTGSNNYRFTGISDAAIANKATGIAVTQCEDNLVLFDYINKKPISYITTGAKEGITQIGISGDGKTVWFTDNQIKKTYHLGVKGGGK